MIKTKDLSKFLRDYKLAKELMYANRECHVPTREDTIKDMYNPIGPQCPGTEHEVELYNCKICHSTISEPHLEQHIKRYF